MQAVGGVMRGGSSGARPWKHCVVGFLTVGLVIGLLAGPLWLQGMVPGDLGDSRYNLYILEHGYRWLSGRDPSLLSPTFFYPYPGTLFWSDTHLGTVIVYSAFRALGVSPYSAFFRCFSCLDRQRSPFNPLRQEACLPSRC
jgi:hypothetical protein